MRSSGTPRFLAKLFDNDSSGDNPGPKNPGAPRRIRIGSERSERGKRSAYVGDYTGRKIKNPKRDRAAMRNCASSERVAEAAARSAAARSLPPPLVRSYKGGGRLRPPVIRARSLHLGHRWRPYGRLRESCPHESTPFCSYFPARAPEPVPRKVGRAPALPAARVASHFLPAAAPFLFFCRRAHSPTHRWVAMRGAA